MTYHITRGGQSYGPYTLADLQRYVASGHVLLSDLARSDEMAEAVPVSQILNQSGLPPVAPPLPPVPEYGSPQAAYTQSGYVQPGYVQPGYAPVGGAPAGAYPSPPNLHWGLLLLFDLLTCHLFQIVWNFVIAAWVKRVHPPSQALVYYGVGYGLEILQNALSFSIYAAMLHGISPHPHYGLSLLGFIGFIVNTIGHFNIKSSLEEHFNTVEPIGFQMSGVLIFLFGGLYIQSQLNRINEIKLGIRYAGVGR